MAMIRIWRQILLVLTVSLSQPTWAKDAEQDEKDWRSTCKGESMTAGLVMINRQYGPQDLYELMDDVKGNAQLEDWYIRAYREPVMRSDFDKDRVI